MTPSNGRTAPVSASPLQEDTPTNQDGTEALSATKGPDMTDQTNLSAAYERTEHFPPVMGHVLRHALENLNASDLVALAAELLTFTTVSGTALNSSVPPLPSATTPEESR